MMIAPLGGKMSNNEIIQLDANFTKWKNSSGVGLRAVEPFLFY